MVESSIDRAVTRWMTGELYPATADESLREVARRLRQDLLDVQADGLLPSWLLFGVEPDESGPVGVLCVTVAGLPRPADPESSTTRQVVRTVFELASHYNRVYLAHPYCARFLQYITTLTDHGTLGAVWITTMFGEPEPHTPRRTAPAPTPFRDTTPVPGRN